MLIWKVSAGTPVGFMGCTESPGEGNQLVDREWFVHLEVLSTDPNMPGFLANPEKVKGDKRPVLFTNKHNEMNPDDKRDFVEQPDLVISDTEYGVESAFSFWVSKGLNKTARALSVQEVTQIVNGGQNGYPDRLQRFNAVAPLLRVDKE